MTFITMPCGCVVGFELGGVFDCPAHPSPRGASMRITADLQPVGRGDGWALCCMHDDTGRRGIWFRASRDDTGELASLEVCAGREGGDDYVMVTGPSAVDLLACLQVGAWMIDACGVRPRILPMDPKDPEQLKREQLKKGRAEREARRMRWTSGEQPPPAPVKDLVGDPMVRTEIGDQPPQMKREG